MPGVSIETGGLNVIDSGYVTAIEDEPIKFTISHENDDEDMILTLEFIDDGNEPDVKFNVLNDAVASATIFNHRTGPGEHAGPGRPINLGTIGGHEIYFIYQIIGKNLPEEDYITTTVGYTWYLGDERVE